MMRSLKIACLVMLFGAGLCSCVSSKMQTEKAIYFRNISDSLLQKAAVEYEPVFEKGDILSISVVTPNETSSRLFNQAASYTGSGGTGESVAPANLGQGYLVDEKGNISFPYLGQIKAAGLTRSMLTETLSSKLRQFIDSGIVTIRLMNYRITVLGEVARPGAFSIPSERVSILDAIGLAGDLTVYGKRNNIRIIRTSGGIKQSATLNLNSGDIFNSPFFYLRQNDIVYVEMNERKIPNTDQANLRNVSIVVGIVSALSVIISTINALR